MSGLALLSHRDGAPVPEKVFAAVLGALDHRGPDGRDRLHLPAAGLGHQHFWTTPEEVGERQPLASASGRVHLLFDGRLDNREELREALELPVAPGRLLSDARLVLAAYERWQEGCFERLLGPFALALYDAGNRRVLCARDPLGGRGLYYHLGERFLAVASEEAALLAHPAVPAGLNEATVARFFAVEAPAPGETFYAAIRELPPGWALALEAGDLRLWPWGEVKSGGEARRYRRDDDYAEHFLELLGKSVRARLRAVGPTAVLMSGGLDSGTLAALAARQRAEAGEEGPLTAISWVFPQLPAADEREYMEALFQGCDLDAVPIPGDDAWPLSDLRSWRPDPSSPLEGLYRRLQLRAYQALRERGGRVLLTGDGGDQLFAGGASWLRDLLAEGRLVTAVREVISGLRQLGQAPAGVGLKSGLSRTLGRRPRRSPGPPPWLTEEACHLLDGAGEPPAAGDGHRRPEQLRSLLDTRLTNAVVLAAGKASRMGVEVRRPMRDRRLVELALSLPAHQLYRPGWPKWILRQATRGLLPEPVRLRRRISTLFPLYARGLVERPAAAVDRVLNDPRARWRRYVRPEWLAGVYPERIRAQLDGVEAVVPWRCLCFELWAARGPTGEDLVMKAQQATMNRLQSTTG